MNQPWRWVLVGGLAAMIGGLFWAVKAVAIMVTRVEPPILFDVAALLFPMAVMGLYAALERTALQRPHPDHRMRMDRLGGRHGERTRDPCESGGTVLIDGSHKTRTSLVRFKFGD